MASYTGHWLYDELLSIDTLAPRTALTYWYALRHGMPSEDGAIDADAMRTVVMDDTQPSRVQRMLKTFLEHRPDLVTEALSSLVDEYIPNPEPVSRATKVLPEASELLRNLEESEAIIGNSAFPGLSAMAKSKALTVWTVLRLALDGFPLRVGELASIAIDDPESPNWLDTVSDVLTLRKHKNDKRGERVYDLGGFSSQWKTFATRVFGRVPATLISNKSGKAMTPKALSTALSRLPVALGSQSVRPAITTDTLAKGAGHTERQRLARQMGHSTGVQADKYFRGTFTE